MPIFLLRKIEHDQSTIQSILHESMAGCTQFIFVPRRVFEKQKTIKFTLLVKENSNLE